jgi:alginate O-acetyltransferase complex protein AlgJ
VRSGEPASVRTVPFNNARPDVIQRVLGLEPADHAQLRCGFITYLADAPKAFTLGVILDEETVWLCEVELQGEEVVVAPQLPASQVIQGGEGWLYLDNDTNRSVDQYTGRLVLDHAGLAGWCDYLDGVRDIAVTAGIAHAVVVAASKEQVLPEHYPHQKGETTALEQVLGLCQPEHHLVDTAALLAARSDREACFIKTDTHWTDRGAMLATLALLEELGLDAARARAHLESDVYYTMPFAGDLGIKLAPAAAAPTEFLQAPPAVSGAVFDNQLPNIGRVLVFANPEAPWTQSLLIFGASSSYPMLKYLKRLFGRVVFIHSAGNVDVDIVRKERPDLLMLQTTARFMIEPPGASFHLADAVAAKMESADADARMHAVASMLQAKSDTRNLPYYSMLDKTE